MIAEAMLTESSNGYVSQSVAVPGRASTKRGLIMRTLVTGAAGFIGSTLVDRLLADGHQVVGVDNLSTGCAANLEDARRLHGSGAKRFTFVRCDVLAPELAGILEGVRPQVVFHLAAQVDLRASVADPQFDARTNVLGTINLLDACRRAAVSRIVYAASGGSRYGAPTRLPVAEDTPINPLSPYAAAKVASEIYLRVYADMYGLTPVILALANVYGPRQDPYREPGVVATFGHAVLTGRTATVFGDGKSTRDYVYVDDVADAFVRAAEADPAIAGVFNIGTGKQTTVTELHGLIAAAAGGSLPPRYSAAHSGEVRAIALDIANARNQLGWTPTVDIHEGIRRTLAWLRDTLVPEPASLQAI
jgi:UDP-glucose 4-epimerase